MHVDSCINVQNTLPQMCVNAHDHFPRVLSLSHSHIPNHSHVTSTRIPSSTRICPGGVKTIFRVSFSFLPIHSHLSINSHLSAQSHPLILSIKESDQSFDTKFDTLGSQVLKTRFDTTFTVLFSAVSKPVVDGQV